MLGACTINKSIEDWPPHKDWLTLLVIMFDYGFKTKKILIKTIYYLLQIAIHMRGIIKFIWLLGLWVTSSFSPEILR